NTPLGTGSFTQLALLSPGVNADFLTGSGSIAGLGNQNIFANGQRDGSNSFMVNGVQAFNVFNHPSFDTPNNNVEFNPFFADPADYVGSGLNPCFTQTTGIGRKAPMHAHSSGQLGMIQHTIGS